MTLDPGTLLSEASAIELQVAAIYDSLAENFSEHMALSRFWALFAEAERYHSVLIQLQKIALAGAKSENADLNAWAQELEETRNYLGEILAKLTEQNWHPGINEAFELAQDIESRSLEVQSRSLDLFSSPMVQEIMTQLHTEDMQHRNKLAHAKARFLSQPE